MLYGIQLPDRIIAPQPPQRRLDGSCGHGDEHPARLKPPHVQDAEVMQFHAASLIFSRTASAAIMRAVTLAGALSFSVSRPAMLSTRVR